MKHGAKVVLRGEAGCSDPSVQPGDVVFVLEQKEHRFFKRINQVRLWLPPCLQSNESMPNHQPAVGPRPWGATCLEL